MKILTMHFVAALALLVGTGQATAGVCAQPVSEGSRPIVRDCIHIARASIGLDDCVSCFCDVDGSGSVQMTDALACLRHVVGNDVELACPECSGSTTTSTTLPGCASCNDVLTGSGAYEDLCPLAKFLYDEMVDCPDTCIDACWCPPIPDPYGVACLANDLLQCLRQCFFSTCPELTQNCREH